MKDIVQKKLQEWTKDRSALGARIAIFEKIRDIPYAIVPHLISAENYAEILNTGKGSCTPKHLLLADMYQRLGITVLLAVYPFRWADVDIDLPSGLEKQAHHLSDDHHLACKADIDGKLVLIDATVDLLLERLGLPVTREWDGMSDTVLPVEPSGEEQLFHPVEAGIINNVFIDDLHLSFFREFNAWLDEIRRESLSS